MTKLNVQVFPDLRLICGCEDTHRDLNDDKDRKQNYVLNEKRKETQIKSQLDIQSVQTVNIL